MIIKKITSKQDGLKLEIAIMECENPKGIVQFSHGMAEHKERYFDFMQYLNDRGYICVIHDHRGHGSSVKSKNDYGYFYTENADYIVEDLFQVTEYVREMYPGLEVTLFSHSMGTLVARCYLKKYDVHALTDVTGFGLLVHLNEMLDEKNSAVIYKDSIPYFDDCQKYVEEFYLSGAAQTNRNSVEGKISFDCDFFTEEILFDPQTSGGLLASVSKADLEMLEKDFKENNLELYVVGEVIEKNEYNVYVRGRKI